MITVLSDYGRDRVAFHQYESLIDPEIKVNKLPVENNQINFKKTGNSVEITIPEEIFRADGLAIIKHFTQMDLFKFVPSLGKVNFIESYENKTAKKEEKPAKPAEKKSK